MERVYKKVGVGDKVGRLLLLEIVGKGRNGTKICRCLCDCGTTKDIILSSLNNGLTQSCGCLYKESRKTCSATHGLSGSPTYNSWVAMRARCYDVNSDYYNLYGGRGITVCHEWMVSFETFLKDMGEKPQGCSLDRIDSDGNYCPENCRWATFSKQAYNQRKRNSNTSGRTGVHFHKATGKWAASIKKKHLGVFESFEDACKARAEAELKYYGENKE